MTFFDPVIEAQIWLQATLTAHAGVTAAFGDRVFSHPAPRTNADGNDIEYPLCTYQYLPSKGDLRVVGSVTVLSTLRFIVQGYVTGNDQMAVAPGSAAIYEAIHGKSGSTANAYILSCVRDRPFYMVEVTESINYLRLGGEYLLQVAAL